MVSIDYDERKEIICSTAIFFFFCFFLIYLFFIIIEKKIIFRSYQRWVFSFSPRTGIIIIHTHKRFIDFL
jgi:hypothetical protein